MAMPQQQAITSEADTIVKTLFSKLQFLLTGRQQRYTLVLLLLMAVAACFEALGIGLIMPFIATLQNPQLIHQQRIFNFIHSIMGRSNRFYLVGMSSLLLGVFIVKNVYLSCVYLFQFRLIASMQVSLTRRLFNSYLFAPYTFHLQRNSANLLNNLYSEINLLFFNVLIPSLLILSESFVAFVLIAMLVLVDPLTSLVALGWIGGFSALFYYGVRKKMRRLGRDRQGYQEQMIKCINQGFGSIKETKILGRESFFLDTFTNNITSFANASRFIQMFNNLPRLFIEMLAVTSLLLLVILILVQGRTLQSLTPTLALFGMAAFRMMPSTNRIISMATQILYHRSAIDVVYKDLKSLKDVPETSGSSAAGIAKSFEKLPFQHAVEFKNISYRYLGATQLSLRDITLTVPKGSVIGLVGPSGAGKTTFVDLLLGLLTPLDGEIFVDGQKIRDGLVTRWQKNIGYIPQNIYLTDDSVRRNVAFGLPDDQIDENKVWHAIRKAQLEEVVKHLPDGLDSSVGERGICLSGGEKQRLGIARALYHNPNLLVMDEATSSLDYETEEQVVSSIEALRGKKTLIVIAHRLSTVRNCDAIYQLSDGCLAGTVRYEDLISQQTGIVGKKGG